MKLELDNLTIDQFKDLVNDIFNNTNNIKINGEYPGNINKIIKQEVFDIEPYRIKGTKYIDWHGISESNKITSQFIRENFEYLDLDELLNNNSVNLDNLLEIIIYGKKKSFLCSRNLLKFIYTHPQFTYQIYKKYKKDLKIVDTENGLLIIKYLLEQGFTQNQLLEMIEDSYVFISDFTMLINLKLNHEDFINHIKKVISSNRFIRSEWLIHPYLSIYHPRTLDMTKFMTLFKIIPSCLQNNSDVSQSIYQSLDKYNLSEYEWKYLINKNIIRFHYGITQGLSRSTCLKINKIFKQLQIKPILIGNYIEINGLTWKEYLEVLNYYNLKPFKSSLNSNQLSKNSFKIYGELAKKSVAKYNRNIYNNFGYFCNCLTNDTNIDRELRYSTLIFNDLFKQGLINVSNINLRKNLYYISYCTPQYILSILFNEISNESVLQRLFHDQLNETTLELLFQLVQNPTPYIKKNMFDSIIIKGISLLQVIPINLIEKYQNILYWDYMKFNPSWYFYDYNIYKNKGLLKLDNENFWLWASNDEKKDKLKKLKIKFLEINPGSSQIVILNCVMEDNISRYTKKIKVDSTNLKLIYFSHLCGTDCQNQNSLCSRYNDIDSYLNHKPGQNQSFFTTYNCPSKKRYPIKVFLENLVLYPYIAYNPQTYHFISSDPIYPLQPADLLKK